MGIGCRFASHNTLLEKGLCTAARLHCCLGFVGWAIMKMTAERDGHLHLAIAVHASWHCPPAMLTWQLYNNLSGSLSTPTPRMPSAAVPVVHCLNRGQTFNPGMDSFLVVVLLMPLYNFGHKPADPKVLSCLCSEPDALCSLQSCCVFDCVTPMLLQSRSRTWLLNTGQFAGLNHDSCNCRHPTRATRRSMYCRC